MKRLIAIVIILINITVSWAQDDDNQEFAMLSAYGDFYSQASDFSLSFLRFRPRGYQWRSAQWNGVEMDNWWNSTIPWSAMGTLSSIGVNFTDRGLAFAEKEGVGTISGLERFSTIPSDLRIGGRATTSISNRTYSYRATAGYNGQSRGWGFAFEATKRGGQSIAIDGVYADSYNFFASISKTTTRHSIILTALYAPSERGVQSASTAEAFELKSTLYNPSWGWQGRWQRSSRVRQNREPMVMVNHDWKITDRLNLRSSLFLRTGYEKYSALGWQNAPNPLPDYYRYMPSFQDDPLTEEMVSQQWRENDDVSQINFQNLFNINGYNTPSARYVLEDRVRQGTLITAQTALSGRYLQAGAAVTVAQNCNFKEMVDLLGGQYWRDIDAYLEQDDDLKEQTENNLQNPNRKIGVGDRFGYDYSMRMVRVRAWIGHDYRLNDSWMVRAGGQITLLEYQREGYYEKQNFPGAASLGRSQVANKADLMFKASAEYHLGGRFAARFSAAYQSLSPRVDVLFLAPEYRNALTPDLKNQQITAFEISADYRFTNLRLNGVIYYTLSNNGSQLTDFYDDIDHLYTHYLIQDIEQRHLGFEASAEIDLSEQFTLQLACALGDNRYTSNPRGRQWAESNARELRSDETIYYRDLHSGISPSTVGVVSINYRIKGWNLRLAANGFDDNYIRLSPLRRTDRGGVASSIGQEKLSGGVTFDLFAGKTLYFTDRQSLGVYMGVNNLLNNTTIKTMGYESSRMRNSEPMASRYYYGLGLNGFMTVTYRF